VVIFSMCSIYHRTVKKSKVAITKLYGYISYILEILIYIQQHWHVFGNIWGHNKSKIIVDINLLFDSIVIDLG